MQKVLALLSIVLVTLRSQLVSAETCQNLRQPTSTLKDNCEENLFILRPNYEDPTTYYYCNGYKNPELMQCPAGTYMCYVMQQCVDCASYIPPPDCSELPIGTHTCTPISGGTSIPGETTIPAGQSTLSTLPTPRYPSGNLTTPTTTSTTKTTTTKTTSTDTTTTPSSNGTITTEGTGSSTDPTPPTIGGSTTPPPGSTEIPPPPSPSTQNTLIPLPPTPPPTPPNVSVEPPYVSPKPGN